MASWGSIPCGVAFFGDDPRPNLPKLCSCLHSLPWQLGKIHSQKKVIHRNSIHNMFFFSSWILGWGSRSFFWTSRISGRVSLQNLERIWGQKVWWMVWTKPSPGLFFFGDPLFWMPTKRGPRLAKSYGCTINPTQKCGFLHLEVNYIYAMITILRVESQPF